MKYVIVLGDGMADEPIEAIGGMTPLEYAKHRRWTDLRKCLSLAWYRRFLKG